MNPLTKNQVKLLNSIGCDDLARKVNELVTAHNYEQLRHDGMGAGELESLLQEAKEQVREEERKTMLAFPSQLGHNLGFIRQYLGELPPYTMVSARELWEIFNVFAPLMTVEQEKELVEALKSVYEKS